MSIFKLYNSVKNTASGLIILLLFSLPASASEADFTKLGLQSDTLQNISQIFMVKHGEQNMIDITSHPVFRSAGSPLIFSTTTILEDGMVLSPEGLLTWSPTTSQFKKLKKQPFIMEFYARDPSENYIIGKIRIIGQGELAPTAVDINLTEEDTVQTENIIEEIVAAPEESAFDETVSETAETAPLIISFPNLEEKATTNEGEPFEFEAQSSGGAGEIKFELTEPEFLMGNLDQYGYFAWTPDFDFTSAEEVLKSVPVKIKAFDSDGNVTFAAIHLYVRHVNRPPVINELPTFYIQFNANNTFQLNKPGLVYDPDGDSVIFNPVLKYLQQGMSLNNQGVVSWEPSRRQFNNLAGKPIFLSFTVEDYPSGAKAIGELKIEISQADLPPEILMIPDKKTFGIKENEELHLSFFITDPNGDNDLLSFDFVTEIGSIDDEALQINDNGQYEFVWTPGFDFIKEQGEKNEFDISFYAIDKESNRTERNILVTVEDTENLLEKDRLYYDQYRTVLERTYDLITQLTEKEKKLEKKYKEAKKGKKTRAITTASLGALTGLSPVFFIENPEGQKIAAGVGGTATATIGTLEASNVIGESPSDIMRDLSYVSQKKNDLLIYGNVFASKYALPLSKREKGFENDLRNLSFQLTINDASKLDLDAAWENSKPGSTKNIKKIFKDFNPDPRFESKYDKNN